MKIYRPLISCLCLTRYKPDLLKRAVSCFEAQAYPNKELIILYEDDDSLTDEYVSKTTFQHSVKTVKVRASRLNKLGELRNLAIDNASGAFICQWDDDDWYHSDRLSYQYDIIVNSGYSASIMTQWLIYNAIDETAYVSNSRLWEGSILCNKELIKQKKYDNLEAGEDTPVIDYLRMNDHICEIPDRVGLYIYMYHGKNTWHYEHWNTIFKCSTALPESYSANIARIIKGEYTVVEGSKLIDTMFKQLV
jgi:glycosyltransferase involved in cell wall biosynthesis